MSEDGQIFGELAKQAAEASGAAAPVEEGPAPTPPPLNEQRNPIEGVATSGTRPGFRVRIPPQCLGDEWDGPEEETFVVCWQLRPQEQSHATQIGGSNSQAVGTEMVLQMIAQVGTWNARGNRDRLVNWWEKIGPVARDLFAKLWLHKHQAKEEDLNTFLSSISSV